MSRTVSVAFMSFNQAPFVREAFQSVLDQEYDAVQVVVFDDGSTDGTSAIIDEVLRAYEGPHDIVDARRPVNDWYSAMQTVLDACDGDWIVVAHGDDVSHPARTARLVSEAERLGVSMVTSNAVLIDEAGEAQGYWRDPDSAHHSTMDGFARDGFTPAELGAGQSFDRRVWDEFGPRRPGAKGFDGALVMRAMLLDGAHLDPEPTLLYRRHAGQTATWAQLSRAEGDAEKTLSLRESFLRHQVARSAIYVEIVRDHLTRHPDDEQARLAQVLFLQRTQRCALEYARAREKMAKAGIMPR